MSQKHIIEIRGGPYDGALLDLADTAYAEHRDGTRIAPGAAALVLFGVPLHREPDGRRYLNWADLEAHPETAADLANRWDRLLRGLK